MKVAAAGGRVGQTYAFEGLTFSIIVRKGCRVGVAADTEAVDELCSAVSMSGELRRRLLSFAYHDEPGVQHLILRPWVR
jgi:hypothetical protein